MEQKKINTYKQKRKKLLLSTIISICLVISFSCYAYWGYPNTYGLKATKDDVKMRYTIYNDYLNIIISPRVDIKNFSFELSFYNLNNDGKYKIRESFSFVQKNKTITYEYKLNDILRKTGLEKITDLRFTKINGKIKNKEIDRLNNIEYDRQCKFEFYYTGDPYNIICNIKNNTKKDILSIQNLQATITFENKYICDVEFADINFTIPLKANEIRTIKVEQKDTLNISLWNISKKEILEQYNNMLKATSYTKQEYGIVYVSN